MRNYPLISKELEDYYEKKIHIDVSNIKKRTKGKRMENYKNEIEEVGKAITAFLSEKNKRYGSSAVEHKLDIFDKIINSDLEPIQVKGILIRLLDKLKRIQNSEELRKNDVADIIGYFHLICVIKKWNDFSDLID